MMRTFRSVLFLFCCAGCCLAQTESLTIGPGDMLHLKVLEAPELEQSSRVSDAGMLTLILGGKVQVAGLTPPEAALAIQRALVTGRYILNPHVSVLTEQTATQNVTILGQVRSPGSYPIGTPRPILDVLALAGGLTDLANQQQSPYSATPARSGLHLSSPTLPTPRWMQASRFFPGIRWLFPRRRSCTSWAT